MLGGFPHDLILLWSMKARHIESITCPPNAVMAAHRAGRSLDGPRCRQGTAAGDVLGLDHLSLNADPTDHLLVV